MPIYEYECAKCGKVHEIMQKFNDKPMSTCPDCGGNVKKIISNTSFVLKGTGWYKTDYASKPKKDENPDKQKTETKAETKETKEKAGKSGEKVAKKT